MIRRKIPKNLRIYDLLREAHKSVKRIYAEFPELRGFNATAIDAVSGTLYLAEGYFADEERDWDAEGL